MFCFFKQKTAYEMRIRDWSSDVCSSDLQVGYMEGFRALPLDNARTDAVVETLTEGGAEVVAQVEGGYTADAGQAAFQDIITANPDVDVVIGSSQAIGDRKGVV